MRSRGSEIWSAVVGAPHSGGILRGCLELCTYNWEVNRPYWPTQTGQTPLLPQARCEPDRLAARLLKAKGS